MRDALLENRFRCGRPFIEGVLAAQHLLLSAIIVAMALLVTAEVICRSMLGFSLLVTEEVAGYMLVAIVFLGMPLALADGKLFRVEFVIHRLAPRPREALKLFFNILSLAFAVILDWQLVRLVVESWERGVLAPTVLATPQYLPQIVMVVGMTGVVMVLVTQIILGAHELLYGTPEAP